MAVTHESARQLALLGILLQALHVLFGITAIIGVLIAHVQIERASGTVYYSQIRWQIVSFWTALFAYALAGFLWIRTGVHWPLWIALAYATYRIACSVWYWSAGRAVKRVL